jgi:hypothetical protein
MIGEEGAAAAPEQPEQPVADVSSAAPPQQEVGGRTGPDPTRFGDWEKNGRCIDF